MTPSQKDNYAVPPKSALPDVGPDERMLTPERIGILQWFHVGEYDLAEQAIEDLGMLGVKHLRTAVSWADCHTDKGMKWYEWLLPRLAKNLELLPCLLYTPPSLGKEAKVSSPPRDPKKYADFLDEIVGRFGRHFEWVELWNEPNNISEWDWTIDSNWLCFCEMIGGAAHWAKRLKKRTVLGGMSPADPNWLRMMYSRGVMEYIDAVGVHGFPGLAESTWEGWPNRLQRINQVINDFDGKARLWITEVGYSTWKHEERKQLEQFLDAATAKGADRVYWYSLYDLAPQLPTVDGFHSDEREYHFGIKTIEGSTKLMMRAWGNGGLESLPRMSQLINPAPPSAEQAVLITGGAGFIGTNLAEALLSQGRRVILYDNLSRAGVERNLSYLKGHYGSKVQIEVSDIRNRFALDRAVAQAEMVFHLASQVAVTTALTAPVTDFSINVGGTINLLEAIRNCSRRPGLLFTSTNKVYGALDDVTLESNATRYEPADPRLRKNGINECRHLDFHSPYGCSKGSADQYVLDYSRSYGLSTVVFRMSCIYGPHQFGTEDQGWVAHFIISAMNNRKLVLYGDGKQVRDILYVTDLINAMLLAQQNMPLVGGKAFNIGGGPGNTLSLLELLDLMEDRGLEANVRHDHWRIGDQKYYVSDPSLFSGLTTWRPTVTVRQGVGLLHQWVGQQRQAKPQVRIGKVPT